MEIRKGTESAKSLFQYIAGLFDIGGCIRIETPKKAKSASLYIWITSKHFQLMEVLQSYGAHISSIKENQYRAKWKDGKAYGLLKALLPYLKVRKEQAKVGMEFFEEKKQSPQETTDVVYKLRLKLLKRDDEEGR